MGTGRPETIAQSAKSHRVEEVAIFMIMILRQTAQLSKLKPISTFKNKIASVKRQVELVE